MASDLPTFAVPPGILGLGRREQDAAISIAGIPLDIGTTNRSGARFGPQAIRQASRVLIDGAHPTAWVNVSKLMLSRGTRFRPESKCQDASFDRMTAWRQRTYPRRQLLTRNSTPAIFRRPDGARTRNSAATAGSSIPEASQNPARVAPHGIPSRGIEGTAPDRVCPIGA